MTPKKPAKKKRGKKIPAAPKAKRPSRPRKLAPSRAAAPPAPAALPDLKPGPVPQFKDIPWSYGENRITLMARDPHWAFAYWEITDDAIEAARGRINDPHAGCTLRVYDTTQRLFDGLNPNDYWDLSVDRGCNSYYLKLGRPAATFHVDIGVRGGSGLFAPIARSGAMELPRDSMSPDGRAEWSTVLRGGRGPSYRHRYVPRPGAPPPPPAAAEQSAPPDLANIFQQLAGEGWTRTEWVESRMEGRMVRWIRWSGPFLPELLPIALAETFHHVEVLFQGDRHIVRIAQGERSVYGPWRVVIEAVGARGERRTIHQWMLRHRWTTEEGGVRIETPAMLRRIVGGVSATRVTAGSEERLLHETWGSELYQLGGSEWRWKGASEAFLAGASETQHLGASDQRWIGGSETWMWGASESMGGPSSGERP